MKIRMKKSTFILLNLDIFACICLFIFYGPFSYIRNLFIVTAMDTASHHYLARTFYSDKIINEVLSQNYIIEISESTDTSKINFDNKDNGNYASIYEEQVLKRDGNELYKIVNIDEATYKGYMAVIYDPSKIKLVLARNLLYGGQKIEKIAKENNAVVAINASGFLYDYNRGANAITPMGTIIQDGEIKYRGSNSDAIIGFTYDNVLLLTKSSPEEAIAAGMRDAMSFGPLLIVNGEASSVKGNGGYGLAPRTAIGQRKDGIVLLVVIDGRSIGYSLGIDMSALIDLFKRYGAYNAANLDGGGSSAIALNGEVLNKPFNSGEQTTRYISNAWIVTE